MAQKLADRLIARMTWLDPASDALQSRVKVAVEARGVQGYALKDALHGRWLGHPLHPALVSIPLGAWTATLALDLSGMESGADLSLGIGIAGATAAALAGIADWSETDGADRRTGMLHAVLNTAGLSMNVVSLILRRAGARRQGVLLSTLAYSIGSVSAFLGGELAYSKGVGVNHTAWDQGPTTFTPVLPLDDLTENTPIRRDAGGVPVVLVRRGDSVFALDATCPHAGGPLDEGRVEGDAIVCPWHGSRFCLQDGSAERGPSTEPAPVFETRLRDGMVEVRRAGQ